MEKNIKIKFRWRFFIYATLVEFIWIGTSLITSSYPLIHLEMAYKAYILLEAIIIFISFLPKRIREDAFASILITLIPSILFFLSSFFKLERETFISDSLTGTILILIIVMWYHLYLKQKQYYRIALYNIYYIILTFIIVGWQPGFWINFWNDKAYFLASISFNLTCIILACFICIFKKNIYITSAIIISAILLILNSIYLRRGIETYLLYDSFNGKVCNKITLNLLNKENHLVNFTDFTAPYKVCLIGDIVNTNLYYQILDFEKMSKIYNNDRYDFIIIDAEKDLPYINKEEERISPYTIHSKYHYDLPLLKVANPKQFWKEIKVNPPISLICIFKNDTIVYQNCIEETHKFLNDNVLK